MQHLHTHTQIQIHRGMRRGSEGKHMLTHHPRYLETHTLLKSLIAPLLSTVKLITAAGQSGTRLQQHGKDPLSPSPSIPHSLHQHLVDICAVPAPLHMPRRSEDKRPCQCSGTPACLMPHRGAGWAWWGTETGRGPRPGRNGLGVQSCQRTSK